MKIKLLILSLLAGFILASCEKDRNGLDPNAKISVTGVHSLTKADPADVPAGGIAGTGITDSLEFITKYAWESRCVTPEGLTPVRAFGFWPPEQNDGTYYMLRDIEKNKLMFAGSDVITADGYMLGGYITTYTDIVVTVAHSLDSPDNPAVSPLTWNGSFDNLYYDTVAYIPNSVVLETRAKITAAFAAGDYDACYKLFDEAYVFLPTTGPKWRALKAAGIE